MTTKHKQTTESHVLSNLAVAIDQAREYATIEEAAAAYIQNTRDSVMEDGYAADEAIAAGHWFYSKFIKATRGTYHHQPQERLK